MAQSICAIPYPGAYYIGHSGGEIVYAGETTRTSYSYLGDTLTQVRIDAPTGSTSLHFTYDGAEYFYLKNAQGGLAGLIDQQGRRLYPIPLLICIDGAEYSFGFSCYKTLPSDFSSTAHLIRIRVCIGYDWRFWDKIPEIAELKSDGELCFSLRDSSREHDQQNNFCFRRCGIYWVLYTWCCVRCLCVASQKETSDKITA